MSRRNNPKWKTDTWCYWFGFFLNSQVSRTFLSIPEDIREKKRIFLFIPAHFEGIWFLIWLVFSGRGAGKWAQAGESRAPAGGGNSAAASMILLKPSISKEMKYLFQTHFLQLNLFHLDLCAHICVCIWMCVVYVRSLARTG